MSELVEIRHAHLFCGLGGGARGFNRGQARVGARVARFRCIGGIDVDPASVRDFGRLAGVPGTVLDLFSREQYVAFHGREPPADWREAQPTDIHRAFGGERPHILFLSPPCKGFSGLLSETRSLSAKYQALNALTLRGIWLALEAYKDDPVEFILLENVPRIATRGRPLLDRIEPLLSSYGYAVAETTHDCGELGGLAQSRKRFLLVARHVEKVPPFLYEPQKRELRPVGAVLGRMLLPGDERAGPMHRVPNLQWRTWVRLAFVEAGSDWRSLQRLRVENGFLADYAIAPEADYHAGPYGVTRWDGPANTVTGNARASTGAFSVADPRFDGHAKSVQLGVKGWRDPAATVTGQMWPGQGPFSVADPRMPRELPFRNVYRVVRWHEVGRAVTGGGHPSAGGIAVADPRTTYNANSHRNKLKVVEWDRPAATVTGGSHVQGSALSVADPRPGLDRTRGDHYLTAGHYGVVPWNSPAYAVIGSARHDNGFHNVADPRAQPNPTDVPISQLPAPDQRLVAVIRSLDGTWHRPFTTLELAALQSLVDPEEQLELDGLSDSAWRERIGNAVPADAAAAIAGAIGTTLLLAWSGETFVLGATPIWVRPIAVALRVARRLEDTATQLEERAA